MISVKKILVPVDFPAPSTKVLTYGLTLAGQFSEDLVPVEQAAKVNLQTIDVIVLNLQSKSIVERALLGSTAERVVRLARSPVLSVPVAGRIS